MGAITAKVKNFVVTKGENGAADVTEERTATVNYDMPNTLDGLRSKFGDEIVASQAEAALVISLQAFMRRHIDATDLQAKVDAWVPETRAAVQRKSAAEKVDDLIGGLSAEDRKALIAKLKAA